jgi:hypothetical protein
MLDGNWTCLKEKMKLRYPKLTEEDLEFKDGEELFYLLASVQKIFIRTKDEIITMIDKF